MTDNTPQIRFKGFDAVWEEKTLGEIANSFEYGLNAPAKEFDGIHKYIRITDIDDSSRKFNNESVTSPDIDFSFADNYKLKKDDILFARTGASVGKSYIYTNSDGLVYFAGFLIRARIKPEFDSNFVFQNTLTNSYENFIRVTSQRSGQPGVNAKEYSTFEINVPSFDEQTKIGTLFSKLDSQITLQQEQLDQQREFKKAMLQKIFPRKGAKEPEIRFNGFSGEWEEKKLGNVSTSYSGGTPSAGKKEFYNGQIPFIRSGEISSIKTALFISEKGLNSSSAKLVKTGDILYAMYGATSGEVSISKINGAINQAILAIIPTNNYDTSFIMQWLKLKKDIITSTYLQGGQGNLSAAILKDMQLPFPSLEEQTKIGNFFKSLDEKIETLEQQLEQTKTMKQALLQKMFV